jgi:DNA-binding NarL/FixJ family response regulator
MMKEPIRVMLVDDHDVLRAGLKSLLDAFDDIQVVAEASDGERALEAAGINSPEVVVMDISMPGMDGLEATRRLTRSFPDCRVLALTVHEDKGYFFSMLDAGATGYLVKRTAPDELVAAIRAVAAGKVFLQPSLARWLLDDYQRLITEMSAGERETPTLPLHPEGLEVLSPREQEVLELVAEGLTNPEIGEELGISPWTVARHRERIMNRLDLHSRTALVKFAIRTGLIDL